MKIERLKLANVRAFEQAEFEFGDGVNLLVGVNGVGKSTVLDSLRFILAAALKKLSPHRDKIDFFDGDDFSVGQNFLLAEINGEIQSQAFAYLVQQQREKFVDNLGEDNKPRFQTTGKESQIYNQTLERPEFDDFTKKPTVKAGAGLPIAVFFSPNRSLIVDRKGSPASSFAKHSLERRELQIQAFADFLLTRRALARESKTAGAQIEALNNALASFLEGYGNLTAVRQPKLSLTIEKDGKTLDVRQLSDGERGVLALVLDLTFRLAAANPDLENPARDGKAVVLIDELDLHLHPKWQREIVDRLERTFRNCQFIASTHSPQIVGEVAPEKIWILNGNGEQPEKPNQSLGMDTNWILDRLMQTEDRDIDIKKQLKVIEKLIKDKKYKQAQNDVDNMRKKLGDFPELVRLQAIINIYF